MLGERNPFLFLQVQEYIQFKNFTKDLAFKFSFHPLLPAISRLSSVWKFWQLLKNTHCIVKQDKLHVILCFFASKLDKSICGKYLQGDQWSGKSWKPWKSQGMLLIYVGSQGIIVWSQALESAPHILSILCFSESKRQHKLVPATVFFHTLSLVWEGLRITYFLALNIIIEWDWQLIPFDSNRCFW